MIGILTNQNYVGNYRSLPDGRDDLENPEEEKDNRLVAMRQDYSRAISNEIHSYYVSSISSPQSPISHNRPASCQPGDSAVHLQKRLTDESTLSQAHKKVSDHMKRLITKHGLRERI